MEASYDILLVAVSIAVAVFASFTALGLASHIPHVEPDRVGRWLLGGAISMGSGIWSMHFIGMLAFHLPIPVAYDVPLTAVSVVIAVVGSWVALYIIRNGIRSKLFLHASALLMAVAICAMHYIGMAAMKMAPPIEYSPGLVFASFLIAYGASLFALVITFEQLDRPPVLFALRNIFAAAFMGGAIAGMHYVGMAAALFSPDSICLSLEGGLMGGKLAVAVTAVTLLILTFTVIVLVYDLRFAQQHAEMLAYLKRRNEELEKEAHVLAEQMMGQMAEHAEKDRLLATVVEQVKEAVITTDMSGYITTWNPAATQMFGYSNEEILGQSVGRLFFHQPDAGNCTKFTDTFTADEVATLETKQGQILYTAIGETPLMDESGVQYGNITVVRDVTEEKQIHDQLTLWGMVFKHSGEAIMISNGNNEIISVNKAFSKITGYSDEDVLGKNPRVLASGKHDEGFYKAMWGQLKEKGIWKGEVWNKRKDGSIYPEWLTITTLSDSSGGICNYIGIFSDATLFKEKEAHIEHLAHHDALTGLPNRLLLEDRLQQAIAHAHRRKSIVAVMFIDLDRFKTINDSLGHHAGDLLLKEIAERLLKITREDDTVSRQGGDEFIVILNEINSINDVVIVSEKLIDELSRECVIEDQSLRVTPSIGISLFPDDGKEGHELIKNADTAMYHAKDMGRANFQFYTSKLNQVLSQRLQLERDLHIAVEKKDFQLYLQPQVCFADESVLGAEVLLRWHHPERGLVSPAEFIPLAEDLNLIKEIGSFVLEESLKILASWQKSSLSGLTLSVNVSAHQLDDAKFTSQVKTLLAQFEIPPERLKIEITETGLMRDVTTSIKQLIDIQKLGVQVSVDDFGTGYSSLSYLKRFPINELKIDKAFVQDVNENPHDADICRVIIALAETLGLSVIAEGVEEASQVEFLQAAGCNRAQGYLYSPPVPLDKFLAFHAEHMATTNGMEEPV